VTPAEANSTTSTIPASIDSIKANLVAGTPAAVVSGGRIYVLAIDPRQLADNAGQVVRLNGQIVSNNIVVPNHLEGRAASATGGFHDITFNKPGQTNGNTRTAGER
jgi:hypothetical protein